MSERQINLLAAFTSWDRCSNMYVQLMEALKDAGLDVTVLALEGLSPRGGYSHTLPIRVCAAQRGRDFEAPDLERGIHFRSVF